MPYYKNNSGFSEIELVTFIVLVTVIVVLVRSCQDIVHKSNIQNNIAQITEYKTAIAQFKNKYDHLPGDIINAKTLWADCPDVKTLNASCNGNGDGIWNNAEGFYVFDHLSRAEMLDTLYSIAPATMEEKTFPKIKITGQSIVPIGGFSADAQQNISKTFFNYQQPSNSFMVYFDSNVLGGPIPAQKKIETLIVKQLDTKLDDGVGSTGDVRASYDRAGLFGANKGSEQCTNSKGIYKDDEDNKYYCNFIVKY